MIGGAYNTTELGVMLDSFDPGNTYRLRVRVNHSKGASYNCYSDYVIFSTSTDPAVRAAQEAAIAAQAAKKATEDSVQYSTDAKNAALAAESKATEAVDLIKALDTKFTTQFTNVQDKLQPTILSVKTTNGATATTSDISPPIFISASGLTHFELSVDGDNWVGPYEVGSSGTVILQNEINTVKVRAYHEDIPDTYAYDQKVVFKL